MDKVDKMLLGMTLIQDTCKDVSFSCTECPFNQFCRALACSDSGIGAPVGWEFKRIPNCY